MRNSHRVVSYKSRHSKDEAGHGLEWSTVYKILKRTPAPLPRRLLEERYV